jgi:hypothetical protein
MRAGGAKLTADDEDDVEGISACSGSSKLDEESSAEGASREAGNCGHPEDKRDALLGCEIEETDCALAGGDARAAEGDGKCDEDEDDDARELVENGAEDEEFTEVTDIAGPVASLRSGQCFGWPFMGSGQYLHIGLARGCFCLATVTAVVPGSPADLVCTDFLFSKTSFLETGNMK